MPANMASPSSQGRRRTPGKTSTEDQALNVIASEAEARLAAKRAARAEARIIRMKELERAQQEADEKMDREYQRSLITDEPLKQRTSRVAEKQISQSRVTPVVENEVNGPVSQETQIRTLQDNIREISEKYKKAMVSNAQLDNEKQALAYQVDCLKDRLEEAEEEVENLRQEIVDKTRELNRLKYENNTHMEELEKAREQIILRDKLLEEHGIPTDGSEQPDISQSELSTRINDSVNLDMADYDLSATSKSRESSRRSSAPDDRDSLLEQIKVLKDQVSDLRRNPDYEDERLRDVESLQREMNKQCTDLKMRIQKLETENARLEGNSMRLETQVKRYKSQAEAAESVEDTLLADKRRLARELRNSQERIVELETEKEHLQKRVEKFKQRRKDDF